MRYESISNLCYKLKQSIKLVSRKSNDFSTFLKVDSFSLQKELSNKFNPDEKVFDEEKDEVSGNPFMSDYI